MNDLVNKLSAIGLFIIFSLLVIGVSGVASFILVQYDDYDNRDFRLLIRWIVASLFGGGMVVFCLHVKGYI